MMTNRMLRLTGAALLLAFAAGCAAKPAPGPDGAGPDAAGPADTRVVDATGLDSDVPSFTVRRQGRLMQVQFYQAGGGIQRVVVTSRSGRALDRADARTAYDAAFAAAQQLNCVGQSALVEPDSATFQEQDDRTALTQGAPAWIFRGRCG